MSYGQEITSSNPPFRWHYTEFDDSNFQIRGRTLFFLIVLFAVIVLVALLFLYARWVCRFSAPPPPPPPAAARLPAQVANHAPQNRGLDAASISGLTIVLHRSDDPRGGGGRSSVDAAECCICLGVFDDGDKVKVLPRCRHRFHAECVDTWLTAQSSCPLCRAAIMVDPPV